MTGSPVAVVAAPRPPEPESRVRPEQPSSRPIKDGSPGVRGGPIATNAEELAALRHVGDRNYYEVDVRVGVAQLVGKIRIRLDDVDLETQHYSMDLSGEDNQKSYSKKNKRVFEPVPFYVIRFRVPHEIVVYKLEKDRIVGYVSAPLVSAPLHADSLQSAAAERDRLATRLSIRWMVRAVKPKVSCNVK